jgi:hypothetical protein
MEGVGSGSESKPYGVGLQNTAKEKTSNIEKAILPKRRLE